MKFEEGDTVTLLVDKNYINDDHISAGTRGVVIKVYTLSQSYLVDFEDAASTHRLTEQELV